MEESEGEIEDSEIVSNGKMKSKSKKKRLKCESKEKVLKFMSALNCEQNQV